MNMRQMLLVSVQCVALAAMVGLGVTGANAEPPTPKWSERQATGAVLMKNPGGKIQGKTKLENHGGKLQYAIMLKVGDILHEVRVNANTGQIESENMVMPKQGTAKKKAASAAKARGKKN